MSRQIVKNHIVYITDENYAMPTVVSIISLIKNNSLSANYDIHVLGNKLSKHTKEIIESIGNESVTCNVISVECGKYDKLAENCLTEGIHVTDTALYKFDIANTLNHLDKVLYLDSDIIVNNNISELFNVELSDNYLASVDEMGDEKDAEGKSILASRIGLEEVRYFNSGVMLLNLRQLRNDNVEQRLLEFRKRQPNYFMDQDAFNGVMHNRRVSLPYCYNFRTALFDVMLPEIIGENFFGKKYLSVSDCLNDQKIIHMSSQFKPWKYNIPWITELFFKYYDMSPYNKEVLSLMSPLKGLYDIYEHWKTWKTEAERIFSEHEKLAIGYSSVLERNKRKIWGLPFTKIKRGSKVILYGAGDVGNDFKEQIEATNYCTLILWVDKNYQQKGEGIRAPEEIKSKEFDYILIAIYNEKAVAETKQYLKGLYIAEEKMITL